MEMPKPGPRQAALQVMTGSWIGKETMHPSPWAPQGSTADARIENHMGLSGFTLIHDYVQSMGGMTTFEGHGVLNFDMASNEYVMHWFDSMGMGVNVFRGSFTDGILTMTAPGMNNTQTRGTWDYSKAGRNTFKMETSADGVNWSPMMDGEYTRQ